MPPKALARRKWGAKTINLLINYTKNKRKAYTNNKTQRTKFLHSNIIQLGKYQSKYPKHDQKSYQAFQY